VFSDFEDQISAEVLNLSTFDNGALGQVIETQFTDASGFYSFDELQSASYVTEIVQENFEDDDILQYFRSCAGISNPLDGIDFDDNGEENLYGDRSVWSLPFDLTEEEFDDGIVDYRFLFLL